MSHIDDARERLTTLSAQVGAQRLAKGTAVADVIIKLTPDAERGAKILDDARRGQEAMYGTPAEKKATGKRGSFALTSSAAGTLHIPITSSAK